MSADDQSDKRNEAAKLREVLADPLMQFESSSGVSIFDVIEVQHGRLAREKAWREALDYIESQKSAVFSTGPSEASEAAVLRAALEHSKARTAEYMRLAESHRRDIDKYRAGIDKAIRGLETERQATAAEKREVARLHQCNDLRIAFIERIASAAEAPRDVTDEGLIEHIGRLVSERGAARGRGAYEAAVQFAEALAQRDQARRDLEQATKETLESAEEDRRRLTLERDEARTKRYDEVTAHARTCQKLHAAENRAAEAQSALEVEKKRVERLLRVIRCGASGKCVCGTSVVVALPFCSVACLDSALTAEAERLDGGTGKRPEIHGETMKRAYEELDRERAARDADTDPDDGGGWTAA